MESYDRMFLLGLEEETTESLNIFREAQEDLPPPNQLRPYVDLVEESLRALRQQVTVLLDTEEELLMGTPSTTTANPSAAVPSTEFTTPIAPTSSPLVHPTTETPPVEQSSECAHLMELNNPWWNNRNNPTRIALKCLFCGVWFSFDRTPVQDVQETGSMSPKQSTSTSAPAPTASPFPGLEVDATDSREWRIMIETWRLETDKKVRRLEDYVRLQEGIFG